MRAGRADDDLLDARGPRGDHAHHDRARVRRAAARHVDRRRGGPAPRAACTRWPCGSATRASSPSAGLGDRGDVRDRHLQAGADRRGRSAGQRRVELVGADAQRAVRRRRRSARRSSRSAASPPSRTAATISVDRRRVTDAAPGAERAHGAARRARGAGRRPARRRSAATQRAPRRRRSPAALSLWATGLAISRAVDDDDLLADDEAVLAQRRAGRGEVDDRLDQAGQRRELDRALDLDDLGLAAGLLEVAARRSAGTSSRRA